MMPKSFTVVSNPGMSRGGGDSTTSFLREAADFGRYGSFDFGREQRELRVRYQALRICFHEQPLGHVLFFDKPAAILSASHDRLRREGGLYTPEDYEAARTVLFKSLTERVSHRTAFVAFFDSQHVPGYVGNDLIVLNRPSCERLFKRQPETFSGAFGCAPTVQALELALVATRGDLFEALGRSHYRCGILLGYPMKDAKLFEELARLRQCACTPEQVVRCRELEEGRLLTGQLGDRWSDRFDFAVPAWATWGGELSQARLDMQLRRERAILRSMLEKSDFETRLDLSLSARWTPAPVEL